MSGIDPILGSGDPKIQNRFGFKRVVICFQEDTKSEQMATATLDACILSYGDSQGEVLDYVFHGHPAYRRYEDDTRVGWRSGWSTRGLGQPEHVARLTEPLSEMGPECKHCFVTLAFGSVDIEWNLAYKRDVQKQDVDTEAFIEEMLCALSSSVDRIIAVGEALRARACGGPQVHVILCFPFMPMPLSDGYMEEFDRKYGGGNYRVIEHTERCSLWAQFCESATRRICAAHPDSVQVVDVREDFEREGFAAFSTEHEDHHPDLARTQHAVAARLRALRFSAGNGELIGLEPVLWPHAEMYPHERRRFPPKTAPAAREVSKETPAEALVPVASSPDSVLAALARGSTPGVVPPPALTLPPTIAGVQMPAQRSGISFLRSSVDRPAEKESYWRDTLLRGVTMAVRLVDGRPLTKRAALSPLTNAPSLRWVHAR